MQVPAVKKIEAGEIAPGVMSDSYRLPDGGVMQFSEDAEKHDRASEIAGSPRFIRVIKAKVFRPTKQNKSEYAFEAARFFPEELRAGWAGSLFPAVKESPELNIVHEVRDPQNPAIKLGEYTYRTFYEAYRDKTQIPETGTPLEVWGVLNIAQVKTLKFQDITTVEMLANVNDAQLSALGMGSRTWRDQARAYIAATTGNAAKIQADIRRQDEEIAKLKAQLATALAAAATQRPAAGAPAPVVEEAPSPTVRRGGRRSAKVDNVEDDVEAEIRAASVGGEDPDFV